MQRLIFIQLTLDTFIFMVTLTKAVLGVIFHKSYSMHSQYFIFSTPQHLIHLKIYCKTKLHFYSTKNTDLHTKYMHK